MVTIPTGNFILGSHDGKPDDFLTFTAYPLHEVVFAKPFAISKLEVTYSEWDACVRANGCPQIPDRWGRGQMPVTNVTWENTKQYTRWLSRVTGQDYRLPSEAEWEYVARAGSTTYYAWGAEIGQSRANCEGCGSRWDNSQTAPVGLFEPNAFGAYDMHGNVWEWVEDTWHDSYNGAPEDGSAWTGSADPTFRVARGGGWGNAPELLRAHTRVKRIIYVEFDTLGFRVARTLAP